MKPSVLLLEMLLFFSVFFLPGYLGQGGAAAMGPITASAMFPVIVAAVPQLLLMIYMVSIPRGESAERWGLVALSRRDALRTGILFVGAFAVVAPFVAAIFLLPADWSRSLSRGYRWGLQDVSQIPMALVFGLATGYREEFFFRSYLLKRLGQLGLSVPLAVAASTALFSLGHYYEGPLGIAIAAVLGAVFSMAYLRWRNLHVIAIAHALYNTAALCLSLFAWRELPGAREIIIFFYI